MWVIVFCALVSASAVQTQTIDEDEVAWGWCVGFDKGPGKDVTTAEECLTACKEKDSASIAADFWPDRAAGKNCWCQDKCDCLAPSAVGGGNGILIRDDDVELPSGKCFKIQPGLSKQGWCFGMDIGPEAASVPKTPKECYDACRAKNDKTVAVDFWDITHPVRNEGNVCWCQDKCDCTLASKSDGGTGWLFLDATIERPASCGVNMKTVVEGSDASVCSGEMVAPKSGDTVSSKMYNCYDNCKKDGHKVATYLTYGGSNDDGTGCMCQADCTCQEAKHKARGYRFVDENLHHVHMCDAQMKCSDVKNKYKEGGCCGQPTKVAKIR